MNFSGVLPRIFLGISRVSQRIPAKNHPKIHSKTNLRKNAEIIQRPPLFFFIEYLQRFFRELFFKIPPGISPYFF